MTATTKPAKPDLLSLLQMVESTPPGDLEWARHCTRQQAVLLRLHLPHGLRPTQYEQIADATGIPVWIEPDLPTASQTVLGRGQPIILIDSKLGDDQRLRSCLREVKRLIDLPARLRMNADGIPDTTYDALADHFADLVLEEHGP